MQTLSALTVFLLGLLALTTPRLARAEDTYAKLVDEAIARQTAGDFELAHVLFKSAHDLSPNARTLRGMGVASFSGGHYVRAIAELNAALYSLEKPLDARLEAATRELLRRATEQVAMVRFQVEPSDAVVKIDADRTLRASSEEVALEPGTHQLLVSAKAHKDATLQVQVHAGEKRTIHAKLDPVVVAPVARAPTGAALSSPRTSVAPSASRRFGRRARVALWSSLAVGGLSGAAAGLVWWEGTRRIDDTERACRAQGGSCSYAEGRERLAEMELTRLERSIHGLLGISAVSAACALSITIWELSKSRERAGVQFSAQGAGVRLRTTF